MTQIAQEDLIQSVADALQYISYYHPPDYIAALGEAYELEQSPAAKDAIAQILTNSRMCAEGHRPICQDTGIVVVFVQGRHERALGRRDDERDRHDQRRRAPRLSRSRQHAARVDRRATRRAARKNTRDNTPAVIHFDLVPGDTVEVTVAAKGGGSENKSQVRDAESVRFDRRLGARRRCRRWARAGVRPACSGIGIGGTAEKAMLLAKESLMEPIDMHGAQGARSVEQDRGAAHRAVRQGERARHRRAGTRRPLDRARREDLRLSDARGVPAGRDDPELRGDAPRAFHARRQRPRGARRAPNLSDWPEVHWAPAPESRRVNLDTLTPAEVASWKPGERCCSTAQHAHGPRRRSQAHRGPARARRSAAGAISRIASSTTSARSIRCATKSSVPRARRRRRAWTSSPR